MLLMFLAFTLVLAYHRSLERETLSETPGMGYVTLGSLRECRLLSPPSAAGLFSPTDTG
jgi:hypothetical protein